MAPWCRNSCRTRSCRSFRLYSRNNGKGNWSNWGYIAASALLIDAVRSFASGFIFTTSLPPAIVAACHASVEHLKSSDSERNALHQKTSMLRDALGQANIPIMDSSETHILPVLIGDAKM